MLAILNTPETPVNSAGFSSDGESRNLLDELIAQLAEKHERISALRRSLPDVMSPGAVEALCNLGGCPSATDSAAEVKLMLSHTCARVDADLQRLCALRRNLPEEFAEQAAEEGLALLLTRFDYLG